MRILGSVFKPELENYLDSRVCLLDFQAPFVPFILDVLIIEEHQQTVMHHVLL